MPQMRRVWAKDANDAQQQSASVAAALGAFAFSHNLRRDVLAYCKLVGVTPHPKLVPMHPDEDETLGADASASVYDVSDTESVTVKNWQLDRSNCQGLCFVLPECPKIHSLWCGGSVCCTHWSEHTGALTYVYRCLNETRIAVCSM